MVQKESESGTKGYVQTTKGQAPRILQLLWSDWKPEESGTVLLPSETDSIQVAKSSKPTPELQLERLRATTKALQSRTTTNHRSASDETASTNLGRIAEASILEEPGAGKPHAGICAGAVG